MYYTLFSMKSQFVNKNKVKNYKKKTLQYDICVSYQNILLLFFAFPREKMNCLSLLSSPLYYVQIEFIDGGILLQFQETGKIGPGSL